MAEFRIEIVALSDERIRPFLDKVRDQATLSYVCLFVGDRIFYVQRVALALDVATAEVIGVGTLAPTDEMGSGGPTIIGVWVVPPARKGGVATQIICALATESERLYEAPASVDALSPGGIAACRKAVALGAHLNVREHTGHRADLK
jgi:hypothetical protein